MTPPRSRTRCTHPSSTTLLPTSALESSPQVWVRAIEPSGSTPSSDSLCSIFAADGCLIAGLHILDRHFAPRALVGAEDGHIGGIASGRVLELLPELVGLRVDLDAQPLPAQLAGEPERVGDRRRVEQRHQPVRPPRLPVPRA